MCDFCEPTQKCLQCFFAGAQGTSSMKGKGVEKDKVEKGKVEKGKAVEQGKKGKAVEEGKKGNAVETGNGKAPAAEKGKDNAVVKSKGNEKLQDNKGDESSDEELSWMVYYEARRKRRRSGW